MLTINQFAANEDVKTALEFGSGETPLYVLDSEQLREVVAVRRGSITTSASMHDVIVIEINERAAVEAV